MQPIGRLNELREGGRLRWIGSADAWTAEPDEVLNALAHEGFEACKHEEVRDPHRRTRGGVWQGINRQTGAVAAAVWMMGDGRDSVVFIAIDGEPVQQG